MVAIILGSDGENPILSHFQVKGTILGISSTICSFGYKNLTTIGIIVVLGSPSMFLYKKI